MYLSPSSTTRRGAVLALALALCALGAFAQQPRGSLRVRVADALGGLVVGASVVVVDAGGVESTAVAGEQGVYLAAGLVPGRYTVRVSSEGFTTHENGDVEVAAGRQTSLDVILDVELKKEEVTVAGAPTLNTDPAQNASAIVLRAEDLDALPDDPEDLATALLSLAGPSAGPGGGQFIVDGFAGGRVPPKASIREIRINQNPFSAEYDRLGYSRVEILTRPGTDKFRGQAFFNFNDEALNSRNPFAPARAPFQSRHYGGNLSGPVMGKSSSFVLDFERREIQDNAVVNATVLDPSLNVTNLRQVVLTPQRRTSLSGRFDDQLTTRHSLVARYSFLRTSQERAGVGDFSLLSRAFDTSGDQHTLQLSETAIVSERVVSETRFQFIRRDRRQEGDGSTPVVRVLEAFNGGGAQDPLLLSGESRWELSNVVTWAAGQHTWRAGGRLRGVNLAESSSANFNGTFTFAGGLAPQLDANDEVVRGAQGEPLLVPITSIERYRRTVALLGRGVSPSEVRARGGGASQFSISRGDPEAHVGRLDVGLFALDDWRPQPNLTLSFGLRYEAQSHVSSSLNFAPRVAFAWLPDAGPTRRPRTVLRGGFGVFYERVGENLTLLASRFDGTKQRQFITSDAAVLDLFPSVDAGALGGFAVPQTITRVARDIQTPYTLQAAVSVERQLPLRMTLTATFIKTRVLHLLRSRNVNAPLPSLPGGLRPSEGLGNIYQFESSGRFDQNQLVIGLAQNLGKVSLSASYVLNRATSDSDGAFTFPVDQYDLRGERGRSSLDVRHSLTVVGSFVAPWGVRLSPFVLLRSGAPFNITTGRDANGDSLFTERPAFATDLNKPGVVLTRFGALDPNPDPGQPLVPRNFGDGPSFFVANLRLSRTFGFGETGSARRQANGQQSSGRPSTLPGVRSGAAPEKRYFMTVSVQFQNLLNRANLGPTIGNLSSPLFGLSNTSAGIFGSGGSAAAGNRRVEVQARFTF